MRMDGKRRVKRMLEGKPRGRRKKRRTRLRWMDSVELDLMNVGIKGGEQSFVEIGNGRMS